MKELIIGFSHSTKTFSPFSKAIRLWDGTEYSHVYFQFRSDKYDVDMIYQASSTMLNYMSKDVFLQHNQVVCEIKIFITEEQYFKIMKDCMISAGLEYGVKQIFGIFIADSFNLDQNIFADPEKYVCSEWVAEELEYLGYKFTKPLDLIKPKDVYKALQDGKN
jgi:hypothetical protein